MGLISIHSFKYQVLMNNKTIVFTNFVKVIHYYITILFVFILIIVIFIMQTGLYFYINLYKQIYY